LLYIFSDGGSEIAAAAQDKATTIERRLEKMDDAMTAPSKKRTVKSRSFRRIDRKSLETRIETLDSEMQKAIEKGEFDVARKLAEEQEKLLEYLMLLNEKF
jgi:phage shock protein A